MDRRCLWRSSAAAALMVGVAVLSAYAQTPAEQGLAIAQEAKRRDAGFQDTKAKLTMILRNKNGNETRRALRVQVLEVTGDGDKSMVVFDSPKDVKGTALLTCAHKTTSNDQWLYLPALKRVKRIASNNQSGPFMGSEFAYEDMTSQEVERYAYAYLRDEVYEGMDCFVIERTPVDTKSGYTRHVAWLDNAEYRVHKVDFYDRKNELLKTLTIHGYQQYESRFWRPKSLTMVNHITGKTTELIWEDYSFRNGLTERDFDKNGLMRAR